MPDSLYRHLLLAADFSPETEAVVTRAQDLAAHCDVRMSLLHVVEYLPMAYSGDLILPDDFDLERELLEVATKQMTVLGERLGVAPEDRRVEVGGTGRTIVAVADALAVDLVVLGSHGRHGLSAVLGSTARYVLNHASCDVLAVRLRA